MDHIFSISMGIAAGLIAGILPGVGHLLVLIMAMPLLMTWSALEIFLFYVIMVQVSQFLGSLTTIFTQVPGETSSLPMLGELKNVPERRIHELVSSTAIGSFAGMLMALGICYFLLHLLPYSSYVYRTEVMLLLLGAAILVIFCLSQDSWSTKIFMLIIGTLLGLIGYNQVLETNILTFGFVQLTTGIPAPLILICVFAIPQLYNLRSVDLLHNINEVKFIMPISSLRLIPSASVLGFIGGLVPGLVTIFSSQMAYSWAKIRSQDPVERITAAETANNAGAISQMIPMLILGLPIVSSEALVLAMMENKGFVASMASAVSYTASSIGPLLVGSIIALIAAWPLSLYTLKILQVNVSALRITAIIFLCSMVFYQAWADQQLTFYVICFILLGLLGWALRKCDPVILIFAYFISDRLLENSSRVFSLYN